MSPQLWLIIVLALSGPATYGVMYVKNAYNVQKAWNGGKTAGMEEAAAATNKASRDTVANVEAGEREAATPVSADKAKLLELCKRSASCRDRKK